MKELGESQSLLIQRSYSYLKSYLIKFQKEFIVAIPSYSEVLFLREKMKIIDVSKLCRNPFLFRGPIPTQRSDDRLEVVGVDVAIPSYSEVLFLQKDLINFSAEAESQSLLIQRSYSY